MAVTGTKSSGSGGGTRIPVPMVRKDTGAPAPSKLKIYTDWANHYLEKNKNRRFITDLQQDVSDGVLLADVIEAVTNEKLQDIKSKPKNSAQMVENINHCLTFLAGLGVNVEGLSAKEIKDGNLKSILGLFFSLSRYKQQQKTQQHKQDQHHQRAHPGETTQEHQSSGGGKNTSHASGEEVQSRLPSYKQNSKCPIIAHPASGRDQVTSGPANQNSRNKPGAGSAAATRGRSQLNQQNNNTPGAASGSELAVPNEGGAVVASRATSPAGSGIPTPGGRTLVGRGQSTLEKSQSRIPQCSSGSAGTPSKIAQPKSSAGATGNKNSMLEKFKIFNSKDKGKGKGGASKNSSKTSSTVSTTSVTSTISTSSSSRDSGESKSSYSALSSSSTSTDGAGATSSTTEPESPRPQLKFRQGNGSGSRQDNLGGLNLGPGGARQGSPSPANFAQSPSSGPQQQSGGKKSSASRSQQKSGHDAAMLVQSGSSKGKGSSLIPKTSGSKTPKSSSSSSLSSQALPAAPNTQIPAPSTAIPKPSSGKGSKPGKEERMKGHGSREQQTRLVSPSTPTQVQTVPVPKKSSRSAQAPVNQPTPSSSLHQPHQSQNAVQTPHQYQSASLPYHNQQQHQQASHHAQQTQQSQGAPPVPPHRGSSLSEMKHSQSGSLNRHTRTQNSQDHSHVNAQGQAQTKTQSSQDQSQASAQVQAQMRVMAERSNSNLQKARYTEIQYSDGKIEKVGQGQSSKSNQNISASQESANNSLTRTQRPHAGQNHIVTTSSVNVVKPTCSTPQPVAVVKADSNAQTMLSVMHRSDQPPPLPKTQPPPKEDSHRYNATNAGANVHAIIGANIAISATASPLPATNTSKAAEPPPSPSTKHDSPSANNSQSSSSGNTSSSSESVVLRLSEDEKGPNSAVNSPRLGLKVLGSQGTKPANNVAIVQPRHGEKIETTFDNEVRTEMINKEEKLDKPGLKTSDGKSKETTFSEKKTTFVDDSGETIDIQPMAPIMRTMHYGYLRGIPGTPQGRQGGHIQMMPVTSGAVYATTGGTPINRLGMNRPMMDTQRYYSGPIKRAMSSGSGSVSFDDYSSDYDTYDYISGYMSDGDILKGSSSKSEDMNSGYMSEGGASLYARRLQQRFREGMAAVKECMQKSTGVLDDDSFDDSSSISSGDISDTINEISTDEGNLTGGSGHGDPYSSLKRGPKDLFRNLTNENLHSSAIPGKRPSLGTSAFLGSDYASDSGVPQVGGWRKYSLQNNRLLSSDPADYAYLYNGYDASQWRGNSEGMKGLRKLSNASQPDIHYRSHSSSGDYAASDSEYSSTKRDSETNTDQSHLYEASLKKMQNIQNARNLAMQFGYGRRPLSNVSTSSAGSSRSSPGSSAVGTRLAKHGGMEQMAVHYASPTSKPVEAHMSPQHRQQAAQAMVHEMYSSASLERKGRGGIPDSRSASSAQTDMEIFKSNSLGRRKGGIGAKQGQNGQVCNSTIISNPHATFCKGGDPRQHSPYTSINVPGYLGPQNGGQASPYVTLEYAMGGSPRNSAGGHGVWVKPGTDNIDALTSQASSIQAQIQQARALSGASARILAHQRELSQGSIGLQRSNSMKSTQSDSYASPQHCHPDDITRTNSYSNLPSPPPPSSPTPSNSSQSSSRFTYPMVSYGSATPVNGAAIQNLPRSSTSSSLPYGSLALSKINKDDEDSLHGSNLSLVSSSSSVYSTAEEKQNHEIRKLRRELESAQEKVSTLTTQLHTNAHVVAAFEQSLSNMTSRLQHLTATAEQKDSELNELRATIEALKRQSGLSIPDAALQNNAGRRHTTPGMVGKELNSHHAQGGRVFHTLPMPTEGRIQRQISSDSMSSINSMSSACSFTSQQSAATDGDIGKKNKKKKGWLRSSFSKAFATKKKSRNGSLSDNEQDTTSLRSTVSVPNSPLLQVHMQNSPLIKGSHSSGALSEGEDSVTIMELRKQLRDKDMKLTDIRLEALSSAHQLEQLRETMNKMKNEMNAIKADNERLQRMMSASGSLNTSQSSLIHHNRTSSESLERTISLTEQPSLAELLIAETPDRGGKRVTITVFLGSNPDPARLRIEKAEVLIGSLAVSGKTKWDILDNIVRKIFKEYVLRIDPVTNLGLSAESVCSYHIGEISRTKESEVPEFLPVGYLVGDTMQIGICLKGTKQNSVDSLAFETLIPKSIVQRYISLLLEHRRIILCGPSGTGKTYLAQKLAEHLVLRSGKELTAGSVATFNVDHKSAKELRQYLANIADQCENTSVGELPSVIILDNLHHVGSLGEVFNGFLSVKYQKCPYIIGTMNQATCSTTNLQLHHNFRWVLCANHMEPVKGFLGRFLRRKLVEAEVMTTVRNNDLNTIIDWVPKVWLHLNKFLETHSSSDVTIGPRLFLSCPMEIEGSKIWFTDLWNYSIVPYMLEAVREGLQVYGRRAPWEDPSDWVLETYPWPVAKEEEQPLLKIRPEDVGYDVITSDNSTGSPKLKNKEEIIDSEGDSLVSDV